MLENTVPNFDSPTKAFLNQLKNETKWNLFKLASLYKLYGAEVMLK